MTSRAVFLDVDGTLLDHHGRVPDSARRAIRAARANGHLVFLCTGRSPGELSPRIVDVGFDGMVAASGAIVLRGDELIGQTCLSEEQVHTVRTFFPPRGAGYIFQSIDGIHATRENYSHLRRVMSQHVSSENALAELEESIFGRISFFTEPSEVLRAGPTKAVYFDADLSIRELDQSLGEAFDVVATSVPFFGPWSGELLNPGVHKASGIQILLDQLHLRREDSIGLGDSFNDLEMLAYVGTGIAMADAPQQVKDAADETTAAPEAQGIREAFLRHGLIDD
nr:HAD family hydrolase [Propionicimonas sp.]